MNKQAETKQELYTKLGNVSIAKYMGIVPIKGFNEHTGNEYYYYNNTEMQDYEALPNYDGSWYYLMSVVEEINKRDWVTIFADKCRIHSLRVDEFETIMIIQEEQLLIDVVFEAVLKYTEWYALNIATPV